MQNLLELAPLAVFAITYYLRDIYVATGALMVAMLLLLVTDYMMTRKIPTMHLVSAVLVVVLGSVTILLHDQRFIQWKPTILFWAFGVAFLLSQWLGKQPLAERLMRGALEGVVMSVKDWRRLNLVWVVFYLLMGALNLLVARNASERMWVNFKVFGITGLTLIFVMAQAAWISRHSPSKASDTNDPN